LDLAVVIAGGVPSLRRFAVPRAGRVLLFAAEDALHILRRQQPVWRWPISTSRSSPRLPSGSIWMPTAATSPGPSPDCSRACSSSIRSYVSTASTKTPAARSCRCSHLREL
jgi:hypothetical protein